MARREYDLGDGQTLVMHIYESDTTWAERSGLYVFVIPGEGCWHPLYIGETDNFKNRLPNHERWEEAALRGATHVHAVVVPQEATRRDLEERLIRRYQPPMNTQLKAILLPSVWPQ